MLHFKNVENFTENCSNYSFFNTKTNKGDIGLYFENKSEI